MDMNHTPIERPASHYETITLRNDTQSLLQRVKSEAFIYMEQLEGWCPKAKASILIDLCFMLKPKTVVEIGVWGGKSLIPMAHALKNFDAGIVYGIDPWSALESVEGMDGVNYDWWSSIDHEKIYSGLRNKIAQFCLQDHVVLIKTTSLLAPLIDDIDILHIDGNHSDEASTIDAHKWVPQVRRGGIIVFDDITWGTNENAVRWMDENCIRLAQFKEDNDWAIWIKP